MSNYPEDVLSVKKQILANPEERLNSVIEILTQDIPEIQKMWESLEARNVEEDDLWVWAFLRAAQDAKDLPRFYYKPAKERRELSELIEKNCKKLSILLKANDLDAHLIHNQGEIFNGFFFYEDFSESNKDKINSDGTKKLKISTFLEKFAERCKKKINKEPIRGKISKNSHAVRFIRVMAERNYLKYETPLNDVLATASNAIFDTTYDKSDVAKLLNR